MSKKTAIPGQAEALSAGQVREAYSCFPSGVVAICALVGGEPAGLVASSFTAVSLQPPLVSFCIQNDSTTWPRLRDVTRLGLSVLSEAHDLACRQMSAKAGDRFAGLSIEANAAGAVFIHGAPAWIDCSVDSQIPAGDHRIVLLRVNALSAYPHVAPLVFYRSTFASLRHLVA